VILILFSFFHVTKIRRVLQELNGKDSKCKKLLICKETKLFGIKSSNNKTNTKYSDHDKDQF
jgi:hypothetical protein